MANRAVERERVVAARIPEQLYVTCEKYAVAAHHFLSAGPDHGARIDLGNGSLLGLGTRLWKCDAYFAASGANCGLLFSHYRRALLSPAGPQHLNKLRSILVKGAYERRDVWPDRVMAMRALKTRARTKKWDSRITELFVKYAIKPHPGSHCEETPYLGVTLACSRDQEAAMYRDADGPTKPVVDLNKACAAGPVHLILAGVNDFVPARVHAALVDPESGRKYASVNKISGVGHLIPQEAPERLGTAIFEALTTDAIRILKSKL